MDLTAANQYFETRLHAEAWEVATESQRQKALATADVDLKPFKPRVDVVRFGQALYEQALYLLEGSVRAKLQGEGVQFANLGSVMESYRQTPRPPHIAPRAWDYLRNSGLKLGGVR